MQHLSFSYIHCIFNYFIVLNSKYRKFCKFTKYNLWCRQAPLPRFGGRAVNVGSHKSASMPRRQHYSRQRSKKDATHCDASSDHDRDDARSKHSVGSSTCYSSSKSNNGRHKRHKRPNRKRPRTKEEPLYNNVTSSSKRDAVENEDESVGDDDDRFESPERRRSSVPVSSEDQMFDPLLGGSEDDSKDLLSSSQLLIHDFTAADLLKRETSV